MKGKNFLSALMMVMVLTAITCGCSKIQDNPVNNPLLTQKSAQLNALATTGSNSTIGLTDQEIEDLIHMRIEEKLARDVYHYFAAKYKKPIFSNIEKSEQVHMDAVLNLINYYGLTDPVAGMDYGVFPEATKFPDLYIELINKTDLKGALESGVAIEEMDIDDLELCISNTEVLNILRVYNNLLSASKRHLQAFNFNLTRL
ncbi:MAG TPA: DUF2202 domain-containing protein [Bacteroidales bacterium]|jgi:hypothetical protein|nr:DUF2202 domain-containing protein [Bacteroidales bacterium]HPM87660.1 DUF2202 domain-containing protein [Bacteroidales bacterium]HQM70751.1 DUF2202 domain-containing protein [Bacteroidales bacterium]